MSSTLSETMRRQRVLSNKFELVLKTVELPNIEIRVMGNFVHIDCMGRKTANKWVRVLRAAGCKVPTSYPEQAWRANKATEHLQPFFPHQKPHYQYWKIKAIING